MLFDLTCKEELFPQADYCLGTDEVGRGPLAGPVVSCTVKMRCSASNKAWSKALASLAELGITDSKKLTEKKRQSLLERLAIDISKVSINQIYENSLFDFVVTEADHEVIDELNIHHASLFAMKQGVERLIALEPKRTLVLVDGKWKFPLSEKYSDLVVQAPIIKGDSKSLLIGVASIIAKEYRDLLMKKLDQLYPGYGLKDHSGYPTPKHKSAIEKLGPCTIHRKSFKGVKEFLD